MRPRRTTAGTPARACTAASHIRAATGRAAATLGACWVAIVLAACSSPTADGQDSSDACAGLAVTIHGTSGDDNLRGTAGDDVIDAGAGNDRVAGLGGDDVLCGGEGADKLDGGDGDDLLYGGPDEGVTIDTESFDWEGDTLTGGPGDDLLDVGTTPDHRPVDTITYADSDRGVRVDLAARSSTGDGRDTISGPVGDLTGSPHADRLLGSERSETIRGGGGADHIDARAGDDIVYAAGTPDSEPTPDTAGDEAPNTLLGGSGNDEIHDAGGDDTLDGGSGDDILYARLGSDRSAGGPGDDEMTDYLSPTRVPGAGRQLLAGGPGHDRLIDLMFARTAETGATLAEPVHVTPAGTIDLAAGIVEAAAGRDRYRARVSSFDDLMAPLGSWSVYGTDGPNEIIATDEKAGVTIHARGGDDQISGTLGDDLLDGGPGRDTAMGFSGRDRYLAVETVRR